jgi:deoxyribodipyrimidine photo-lyase
MTFNTNRVRKLNNFELQKGGVIYWMSRDQRVADNWALILAHQLAVQNNEPLVVIFCLQKEFLNAQSCQFEFMLGGFREIKIELEKLNIPFVLLDGSPEIVLPEFIQTNRCGGLVSDFSPLKIKKEWLAKLLPKISIPFFEVDSHNIIPAWKASSKQEFGAYTIRPKIHRLLPEFLTEFPVLKPLKTEYSNLIYKSQIEPKIVSNLDKFTFKSGSENANQILHSFVNHKLVDYNKRNDPNLEVLSNLSPYLHFGQISAQRVALEVIKKFPLFPFASINTGTTLLSSKDNPQSEDDITDSQVSANAFLEELIVRKELADNFCFYNSDYDNFEGLHAWAKQTLNEHRGDVREFIYSLEEFKTAKTHDDLWNSAQLEMLTTGKMHGFMRMYWAKKILEWTPSPEKALEIAIYLNDKYELDGRDPNGYTGMSWAIGGTHDRAWGERQVFGKIRYMNYNGCKRKFDIKKYITKFGSSSFNEQDSLFVH